MQSGLRPRGRRALIGLCTVTMLLVAVISTGAPPAAAQGAVNAPFGFVDQVTSGQSGVLVSGWVIDADTTASIDIHVYRDGAFLDAHRANGNRPDVAAVHPKSGAAHGFAKVYPTPEGRHTFCVYGINVGVAAANTLLGCRSVNVTHDPFGWLDSVQRVPGTRDLVATGWALDADTPNPLRIHVYANGVFVGEAAANGYRSDVAAVYPLLGGAAAFSLRFAAAEDVLNVCAYALGVGPGAAWAVLGCTNVNVSSAAFGYLDSARVGDWRLHVRGWAYDPDTADPIMVHFYVDGIFAGAASADSRRDDVAAVLPGYGAQHGYDLDLWLWAGATQVCAYAINVGGGPAYSVLGCQALPPMPPSGSGTGRRIVYANLSQRVWLVGDNGLVDHTYLVSGKYLDPPEGTYAVYAFQRYADAGHDGITMEYFVAFHPAGLGYGFHTIPLFADGTPLQSESELGSFRSSGCVRQRPSDAIYLWNWVRYGDPVVLRYV